MVYNAQVAGGLRPDGRQRWAIDQILEWQGKGAQTRVLVKWLGFDPDSGELWADSWIPKANLTADLREADPGVRRRHKRSAGTADGEGDAAPTPAQTAERSSKWPKRGEDADLVMISYVGRGVKQEAGG